ncbi:acetyl/propionyl/methylcrotonyl-CoA carboxylase subunit alpha [Sphingopyxis witflariensis]|uniref:3-methylcrotonyl-CoA carboxylase n=1 Tax=Sphingopyxis witflariensis TaxID=173675 RepID=A0A246K4G5_9SPHN|nr:biotin carboxylase N-terminal domain-containing protein [Sphingopyxis witflariensis]OWR00461.1 3-methylcrotonyl-CoA carboxylase [Sphingopyxis witflariensis]
MKPFSKILIANRGEIACRVIRSAKAKGYATVAVFSDADAGARHVLEADEAFRLGGGPLQESYLSAERVLAAARATGADALHPGYGFFSENADFAEQCAAAGITFIGPMPDSVRVMGDKARSKRRMIEAGVPCVPGYEGDDQDDALFVREADRIGYPVMVKASAGGGGRGMRLVHDRGDLAAALVSARSEAKNAFGDDRLLLERAVVDARHVEIQVFGDSFGSVVHLGERDCSVQRRHQKVIEEAPSPAVDEDLRRRMGDAAVRAAAAIDYVGAGTVEFLLGKDGEFYFLEMNTRLQVEHPVTECVTGIDLVDLQIDVAAGLPLPFAQDDISISGHAIEVRFYAEDPRQEFLPQTGVASIWQPATGDGVRIDHGLVTGQVISSFYDPMIAKIIATGANRDEALRRLVHAVRGTHLLGVATNREFLLDALSIDEFRRGDATTAFIGKHYADGFKPGQGDPVAILIAAILAAETAGQGWSSNGKQAHQVSLASDGSETIVRVARAGQRWSAQSDAHSASIAIVERGDTLVRFEVDGLLRRAVYLCDNDEIAIDLDGRVYRFEDTTYRAPSRASAGGDGVLRAPMTGTITAVRVGQDQLVARGDVLAVLEAMKMEQQIIAPIAGKVTTVAVAANQQVAARDILFIVEAEPT